MRLYRFLIIKAGISIIFGLSFLLIPEATTSLFGVSINQTAATTARYMGALLLGIGFICWFARLCTDYLEIQGILLSLFIADTLGFLIALFSQLSGLYNTLGWVNVAIWFLLALGLGYFRFINQDYG
jgi:hypothetical protein